MNETMRLRIFRTPQHQQFDYKPRFWDPKREEMEERLQRIDELERGGVEGARARIRGGFRRGSSYLADGRVRRRMVMRSNAILLGILVGLIVLCYFLLRMYLPELDAWLAQ